MNKGHNAGGRILAAVLLAGNLATTADAQQVQPPALTEAGQKLEAGYAAQLEALKAEITKALPVLDERKKAAYFEARKAEKAAEAALNAAQQQLGKVQAPRNSIRHANRSLGHAEWGITAAEAALNKATTDAERDAAQKDLANFRKDKEDALAVRKKGEEALAAVKPEEPGWIQERDAAAKALDDAKAQTMQAVDALGLDALLSSDKLDSQLVKFVVLFEATPSGLATFAQQGAEQAALVDKLLNDPELMKQMLVADGARPVLLPHRGKSDPGQYGPAMKIYTDIQKASKQAGKGVLQRLALAIALEHSVPLKQDNPLEQTQAPATVDPVKRYLAYQKAWLDGELEVPTPGRYQLTARVVTVRDGGKIQVTANHAGDAVDMAIPYTYGKWEQTHPVEVTLVQGKNTLAFSKPEKGFTLKDITLTPVK